ncbi:MAG: MFS transporter, partial [Actinomycetota bacterium]|nr:MFS transporter [Actinomycetota bacterium]
MVFAGNGVLFASLFSRLPEVQSRLARSEGELGVALLGGPVGLVGAVGLAGAGVVRAGSQRV